MKRYAIAGFAAGAAMMIGGALGAVSNSSQFDPRADAHAELMNPMVAGQAMLPGRDLLENISASPEHTVLKAALEKSGVGAALKSDGEFTVFAPTNAALAALPAQLQGRGLARLMDYLIVPGKYDSQALLKAIGQGGGQAKLRTIEGGVVVARMNGPTNIILVDQKGNSANIAIYDVYDKNGVMHVIDHMLEPGPSTEQVATK